MLNNDGDDVDNKDMMFGDDDALGGYLDQPCCCCKKRSCLIAQIVILSVLVLLYSYASITTTACPGEIDYLNFRKLAPVQAMDSFDLKRYQGIWY